MQRTASAPSSFDATGNSAGSNSGAATRNGPYKSASISLQVQLRERLAQALPDSTGKLSEAQLRIYSEAFQAVIDSSQVNAGTLQKVKEAYDSCVAPWMLTREVQDQSPVPEPSPDLELEVELAPRILELQQENRRLRAAAGLLHKERLRRIHQSITSASGDPEQSTVAKAKPAPPWSAMRVTATGVRGNGY